jgi:head-tail adaptor
VFSGDQLADRIDQVFTIRYEPGITSAYRVMWRDQLWDISRVRNVDNADAWLELTCERREAGAQ